MSEKLVMIDSLNTNNNNMLIIVWLRLVFIIEDFVISKTD